MEGYTRGRIDKSSSRKQNIRGASGRELLEYKMIFVFWGRKNTKFGALLFLIFLSVLGVHECCKQSPHFAFVVLLS